jgi:hypothetical protein
LDGEIQTETEHVVVECELEAVAEMVPVGRVRFVVGDFVAREGAAGATGVFAR